MIATVTAKGQVTLPVEARRRLGITAGTKLEFLVTDEGTMVVIPRVGSMRRLKGLLPRPAKALTLEDMEEAIASGAAR